MGLQKFLTDKNYHVVKLKRTVTNHFEFKASINGIEGRFILDTGASNSCLSTHDIEKFGLITEESDHKAAGAGSIEIDTLISKKNKLEIGKYKLPKLTLVLIDLSNINTALLKQEAEEIDGIIGADVLEKTRAVIDYKKKKLYLKKK